MSRARFYDLCIDRCSRKCLSVANIGYRPLGAPIKGEEPKVEDQESEDDKGNRVTWDGVLFPPVSPGQGSSL